MERDAGNAYEAGVRHTTLMLKPQPSESKETLWEIVVLALFKGKHDMC